MNHSIRTMTVHQLVERKAHGKVELIDVRTPLEYFEVRAVVARNIPLADLDPHAVVNSRDHSATSPLFLICKSGKRGAKACQKFIDAGYTNVVNIEGGTEAWVAAGLPVVRGKKVMSLERQVRIAAGSIVLVGAVAAMVTGNVYLAGIPAFVGAGLMFAGITDSCAMGMLIARMPWNQVKGDGGSCTVN